MSDVIPTMSPIPILKMEGGGVLPLHQTTSVIQPMSLTQSSLICASSIITSHPAAASNHQLHIISSDSVPSLVNDDIAEADNIVAKDPLHDLTQVSIFCLC